MNWSLDFGQESVFLEVRHFSTETVVNSIELPLSVWNLLENQRLQLKDDALTGAPLAQEHPQRPCVVHENLEVPVINEPFEGGKVKK